MSEVDSHAKPLAMRSPGITGASKLIMLPQKDGGSAGMQRKVALPRVLQHVAAATPRLG